MVNDYSIIFKHLIFTHLMMVLVLFLPHGCTSALIINHYYCVLRGGMLEACANGQNGQH